MKIFITGDRSLDPINSCIATAQVLAQLFELYGVDVEIYTGSLPTGIERAVRYLIVNVNEVPYSEDDNNHTQFSEHHELMAKTVDLAVMIHPDPLSSRIGASLIQHFTGEKLLLV